MDSDIDSFSILSHGKTQKLEFPGIDADGLALFFVQSQFQFIFQKVPARFQ